jgi:hypothetical protein
MADKMEPGPFEWHKADQYLPPVNEVVIVHQLARSAVYTGTIWLALDGCGNRSRLVWKPEFWRRPWQYFPPDPMRGD